MEITNGFVGSRHLDEKAGVACLIAAVKALHDAGLNPAQTTHFHISNYEEVGHGAAAGIPADTVELLSVDMAAVGAGQTSDEFHATLCVKDSGGHIITVLIKNFATWQKRMISHIRLISIHIMDRMGKLSGARVVM